MRDITVRSLVMFAAMAFTCFAQDQKTIAIDTSKSEAKNPSHLSIPFASTANQSFVLSFDSTFNFANTRDKNFSLGLESDKVKGRSIKCSLSRHPNPRQDKATVSAGITYFSFMGKNQKKGEPDVVVKLDAFSRKDIKPSELAGKKCNWRLQYSSKLRSYCVVLSLGEEQLLDSGWKRLYQEEMGFNRLYVSGGNKKKKGNVAVDSSNRDTLKITYNKTDSISLSNICLRLTDEF
jgi:hypothetical protein